MASTFAAGMVSGGTPQVAAGRNNPLTFRANTVFIRRFLLTLEVGGICPVEARCFISRAVQGPRISWPSSE
jgi:hypothetical protein